METWLKIRTKSSEEMDDFFTFDEVLNIRYFKYIGENLYEAVIRTAECDLKCIGTTTLQSFKEKIVKGSGCYPLKSKVTFEDGTERIFYSSSEYWEKVNPKEYARIKNTKVINIERL